MTYITQQSKKIRIFIYRMYSTFIYPGKAIENERRKTKQKQIKSKYKYTYNKL